MRADNDRPQQSTASALRLAYRLRWKRRRLLFRILRKRRELKRRVDRTQLIGDGGVLAFCCVRNEAARLPYFLNHYRQLGVCHFIFVDNDSSDGTAAFLADQPDVSLWHTSQSYRLSRFGMDWLGWLQLRFGHGHWCLTLDADELLVYPHHDQRDLAALTDWLDRQGRSSFGAVMIELYPKGPVADTVYCAGDDPLAVIPYFDTDNYRSRWHPVFGNLWIQGGVRDRMFFGPEPERAPTLNKTPLVRWHRRYAYVSSTHQILPARLHDVFSTPQRAKLSGALLHTKFLPMIGEKSSEELTRKQHFENSGLYVQYHQQLVENPNLWHPGAGEYRGWEQLVALGLMSAGDWH